MIELTITQEIDENSLAEHIWRNRSGDDEVFKLIKELDKWPEDWGFTHKLRAYFMRVCDECPPEKDEHYCKECHELIYGDNEGHFGKCKKTTTTKASKED